MTTSLPETIGPQIQQEMNAWVVSASHFLGADEAFQVKKWEREISKLEQADAAVGSMLRAQLAGAKGNIDDVEYWVENARKLHADHPTLTETYLVACSNLTYGTRGLKCFRENVDIKAGSIGRTIRLACSIGAFGELLRVLDQARKGNVNLDDSLLDPMDESLANFLQSNGVEDAECAAVIDVAGEVMRERNLFWLDKTPRWIVDEESNCVLMQFRVGVSPENASEMNVEAVNKLIERDLDRSPYMVGFLGVN